MAMVEFTDSRKTWSDDALNFNDIVSGYGASETVLKNDELQPPVVYYVSDDVTSVGKDWATWSGGYTGDVIVSDGSSLQLDVAGAVAFGFELEPDQYQAENFTITLSNNQSVSYSIAGYAGAGFVGYIGSGITSIDIVDNSDDNFAIGDFFVEKDLGMDYRAVATTDPIANRASTVASKFNFVGEYLGSDTTYLTAAKARNLSDSGLRIFSIYETAAMASPDFFSNDARAHGRQVGASAYRAAMRIGQGSVVDSAIYFAVDFDPGQNSTLLTGIAQFFRGVAAGFQAAANALNGGTEQNPSPVQLTIGVYGAGITDNKIKNVDGLATYSWLAESRGWTGSNSYQDWNLKQVNDPSHAMASLLIPTVPMTSSSYDAMDLTNGSYFGQWSLSAHS